MNKTEILSIVNEPSKHIQIVKIDGKDSIVYSSKFVELLELIPTMLTKSDVVAMLEEIRLEATKMKESQVNNGFWENYDFIVKRRIDKLKGEETDGKR